MLTTEYPSQALSNVIRELDQAVQDHPGMLNAGLVSQAHKLLQDARRANAHEEQETQDTLREGRRSLLGM
jgi:hypothetical protein